MPEGIARLHALEGTPLHLSAGPWRAVYVDRGGLRAGDRRVRAGDGAMLGQGALDILPDSPSTLAYLWEVGRPGAQAPVANGGLRSLGSCKMPCLAEDDPEAPGAAALRLERVDLIPGVETPPHTHRGSGLRVLLSGRLEAEIDGARRMLAPGDAWLETGPGEVVVGRAAPEGRTAFVRLLVLPAAAAGQDSFVDLSPIPGPRPRPADYRRFFEREVML